LVDLSIQRFTLGHMRTARAARIAAPATRPSIDMPPSRITLREREILVLVGQGLISSAIALRLGLARCTVESHIRSAMAKLGARTRLHAAALLAATHGGDERVDELEPDQLRLLEAIASGHSLAEVAATMNVSVRTAARRLVAARMSLGVRTTAEAVAQVS
jgi:DNA-binding CsgD family transcriptional regulator